MYIVHSHIGCRCTMYNGTYLQIRLNVPSDKDIVMRFGVVALCDLCKLYIDWLKHIGYLWSQLLFGDTGNFTGSVKGIDGGARRPASQR